MVCRLREGSAGQDGVAVGEGADEDTAVCVGLCPGLRDSMGVYTCTRTCLRTRMSKCPCSRVHVHMYVYQYV